MAEFKGLRNEFQNAKRSFEDGTKRLMDDFKEFQVSETGRISLDDGFLNTQTPDFSLFYCLAESLAQVERAISEKPSRELSLVKTKIQEAIFWADQV